MEKIDNPAVRAWLEKHVKGAGDIPSASHIRREYVPRVGEAVKLEIKEKLHEKPVIIYCDETTDRKGNCVFAVLLGTIEGTSTQQLYLGSCTYLETANSTNCVRAILDTIRDMNIEYSNVYGICSDSAPYMIACSRTLKTVFGDQFIAFTCWCHKPNLIGEIWQGTLKELNGVVAKLKNIFRNSRKLKREYKMHLAEHFPELPPNLFPIPVLTRWSSWFQSVEYLSVYFPAVKSFLHSKNEGLSPQGQALKELMTPSFFSTICIQAAFVNDNSSLMTGPILDFQKKSAPVSHLLYGRLQSLLSKCDVVGKGQFGVKVNELLEGLNNTAAKAANTLTLKLCGASAAT